MAGNFSYRKQPNTVIMNTNKKFPAGIKAALIDMDGVLYDSMPFHASSWHKLFTELGVTNSNPDEYYLYEGMKGSDTIGMILKRELGVDTSEEERTRIYSHKSDLFRRCGEAPVMPGAKDMLKALKDMGLITVLVTGSAQKSLLGNLNRDYPGYFPPERMVTALDVKNGKPHPEPYLKGLEKSGVGASETIVIENAPLGVRAGKAAGCFTIAVTTGPIPRETFEKEGADMIFPDMTTFAKWLKTL